MTSVSNSLLAVISSCRQLVHFALVFKGDVCNKGNMGIVCDVFLLFLWIEEGRDHILL